MYTDRVTKRFYVTAAITLLTGLVTAQETSPALRFLANDGGGYTFDTGVLRGALRQDGRPRGLSSVVHVPTGTRLDRSLGICSHYRVFTTNHRYGTAAWDWPGTSKLLADGAVQTTWPEAADRPFEMTAIYRWKDPQTLDVETTVTARKDLRKFESFLASYFDEAFASPYVYVNKNPEAENKPGLLLARRFYGNWHMYPKDAEVVHILHDGRWQIEPNPVEWTIMPPLAAPVCLRRNAGKDLSVILMSPPQDCFAIATPHEGESHYSLYLSLFGRNLKANETAIVRTRLLVTTNASDDQVVAFYRQYLSDPALRSKPAN